MVSSNGRGCYILWVSDDDCCTAGEGNNLIGTLPTTMITAWGGEQWHNRNAQIDAEKSGETYQADQ
jgi:hypothetical protein